MKYVILPLWKLLKVGFRSIVVLVFIITSIVSFVLNSLWEFKLDFSYFYKAKDSFLKEVSYSEFADEYYYQTPKNLWDFIWNGLKEVEVCNDEPTINAEK
jgi:hypothetical protein